ncbi:MAG: division/cell wall cluster transcriptional repressor MraZ [Actinomycetota bacterium]|nr:division/cell wall cluster transcriptional repressor MraZ [Actinomycetota bacterium]
MFVGTFEHSLDDKGRVVLPTAFRTRLAEGGYLGLGERCLSLWTPEEFSSFVERLREKVRTSEADHNALRVVMAYASDARPDSQGRITIPGRLREYAALDGEVVINGTFDRIEIWNPDRWREVSEQGDRELSEAVRSLGIF